MAVRVIREPVIPHKCDLPKRGPFWNRNPICKLGTVVQCNECGAQYEFIYAWDDFIPSWQPLYGTRKIRTEEQM